VLAGTLRPAPLYGTFSMTMDFTLYSAVLLDLDGTLYHEQDALPGAVELVHRLQSAGQLFACLSNSTASPAQLVDRLARMGMQIPAERIYTAARAAADYVVSRFQRMRIFNLGGDGIAEMLQGRVTWVQAADEPCDVVIVGAPVNSFATFDRQLIGLTLLRSGAALVGICADRVYPSPRGIEFGAGAFTSMFAYASNVKPVYCGKPETIFFNELCHRLKVSPDRCILIGDNLEADIAGGKAMGMVTVLTLTGVARAQDLTGLPEHRTPDRVIRDLTEISSLARSSKSA
jgi:4-nitrophenyl phosphatase